MRGWDAIVMTGSATEGAGGGAVRGMMDDPMAMAAALVARLMMVLEMVIAEPGTRVCDPKM